MALAFLDLARFFDVHIRNWRSHFHRVDLQRCIQGKKNSAADNARKRRSYDDRTMSAHQRRRMIAHHLGKVSPKRRVADEHVGHSGTIAYFKDWNTEGDESRAVVHRLQGHFRVTEGYERRCMSMHDRHYVGTKLIDFTVNIALGKKCRQREAMRVYRMAVEIKLDYVLCGYEIG